MSEENEKKIYRGRIKVPYKHTAGDYVERFMEEIGKNNRIMGVKCPECGKVYIPPKMVCFECFQKMEKWVEVGKQGVVEGFTVITHSTDVMPLKPPFGYGIIHLDGADTGFVHIIRESDPQNLSKDMRVEAVFKDRRQKKITDIEYFKPI